MFLRILAVGDSYMPVSWFEKAFTRLELGHEVVYLQLNEDLESAVPEDSPIREYAGSPAQIAEAIEGVDVLAFHGAPVTAEVIGAADGLQLACCARGGPVNVDRATLAQRGIP